MLTSDLSYEKSRGLGPDRVLECLTKLSETIRRIRSYPKWCSQLPEATRTPELPETTQSPETTRSPEGSSIFVQFYIGLLYTDFWPRPTS